MLRGFYQRKHLSPKIRFVKGKTFSQRRKPFQERPVDAWPATGREPYVIQLPSLGACAPGVVCLLRQLGHVGKERLGLANEEPHVG